MHALGEDIGEKVLERTNGNSDTLFYVKKMSKFRQLMYFS